MSILLSALTLARRLEDIPAQRMAIVQGGVALTFGDLFAPCAPPRDEVVEMNRLTVALPRLVALDGQVARVVLTSSPLVLLPGGEERTGETVWWLASSGTSGPVKWLGHTLASLSRTIRPTLADSATRWGLLYDASRFAGLQVMLQSLLSGATLLVPDRQQPLEEQVAMLAALGCSHLSATPTLWRKLLMTPGHQRLSLRQITLGGERVDQAILDRLSRVFPAARISHIFASTEAGVAFSVQDGREGFPVGYLHQPPNGIALRLVGGRLLVANPLVAQAPGLRQMDEEGFVDSGDLVEVVGDRVYFLGRESGMINVGGNKVFPETIEGVVNGHPEVACCRVASRKSPFTGALVTLEVVARDPQSSAPALEESVRLWCLEHLPRHAIPVNIRVVASLATSGAGKLERNP